MIFNVGESSVRTVNGSTGDVSITPTGIGAAASSHTHAATDITSGELNAARIPALAATKITSGTFDPARIPSLSANKITSDTLDPARIPSLPASKITSGELDIARVPKSYSYNPIVVELWANSEQSSPSMEHGTTISGTASAAGGKRFAFVVVYYRVASGDQVYIDVVPFEGEVGGNLRYGTGYSRTVDASITGTHYSRNSLGYLYFNPSNNTFSMYAGTGYKGTSANKSAMVPILIRAVAYY